MASSSASVEELCSMVILMGTTGSGKSFFIDKLKQGSVEIGDDLYSREFPKYLFFHNESQKTPVNTTKGTSDCQIVVTKIGRSTIAVVDCPGFNDTRKTDVEVLAEIAKVLSTQYLLERKLKLRGILWLRDITKTRMDGSDVKVLDLFCRLVGKDAFRHVVLVTTMWDQVNERNEDSAYARETQLKDDFWREMILEGSYTQRFLGSKASAQGIISQLVGNRDPITLQIQRDLVDKDMRLSETAAGSVLALGCEEELEVRESILERSRARLEAEPNGPSRLRLLRDVRKATEERDKVNTNKQKLDEKVGSEVKENVKGKLSSTWQDTLKTICAVVGASVSVVGAILPAVGVSCTVM